MKRKKSYRISYRKAGESDRSFLLSLYASTREDLIQSLHHLSDQDVKALIEMQFSVQDKHYKLNYPKAKYYIIQLSDKDIGRLYLDNSSGQTWIIDITIDPAYRSKGIGKIVMEHIIAKANYKKETIRLHVAKSNPAFHFYERLGFTTDGGTELYHSMCRKLKIEETKYQSKELLIPQR